MITWDWAAGKRRRSLLQPSIGSIPPWSLLQVPRSLLLYLLIVTIKCLFLPHVAVGLYFMTAIEKQTGTEADTRVGSGFDGPSCLISGEDCGNVWDWGLTKQLGARSLVSSCGSLKGERTGRKVTGEAWLMELQVEAKTLVIF